MATIVDICWSLIGGLYATAKETPLPILLLVVLTTTISTLAFIYALVYVLAPVPRAPHPSEKTYITTSGSSSSATAPRPLPCWHDAWLTHRKEAATKNGKEKDNDDVHTGTIDEAEVEMSVVIPAYNEEERIEMMLEEAVAFLDDEYGRVPLAAGKHKGKVNGSAGGQGMGMGGYEILIVNDGSKDKTVDVALDFSRKKGLHDILRVCTLKENRGKGGAVTHGFRHVRGAYAIFADADGASKFEDSRKLVRGCKGIEDGTARGIAVGSRAHLVGSEAVVKRSALRNALMHSFHLLLRLLTPPATSRIRDTQCGFKLFSRAALPHIVPYMHVEGWIFDVEMLMLAESAPAPVSAAEATGKGNTNLNSGIRVAEVQIGWHEFGYGVGIGDFEGELDFGSL
ncbi:Nucleotide-diphospho-sugar transferase [Venustampulla echinocandica]|uniref:dolichyl-phosphate beta-glucosyltransferase n=1 Tax=Venustampulla echinocandica TaxID=2656787 RepID=A0A370TBL3_9HELO|nr:Nucleotide-diphospho-sugar transferase [Venustampulla echinocandica]RDL31427.1 Nucleotide-diphospho-sugar transferase [Venustampulla echinocandica]